MSEELKSCPFCGSETGYYMLERVHRYLMFDFNDTPDGATEDITEYIEKRMHCRNCGKILPKSAKESSR